MVAAYVALLSLFHVLENVKLYARNPISFNKIEKDLIETLRERVSFLIDFVEKYSYGGCQVVYDFQSRITDAAHEAEDIVESHIVDQILDGFLQEGETSTPFSLGLERVIHDMGSIKKEMVLKTEEEERIKDHPPRRLKSISSTSSRAFSSKENNAMVGSEDELIQILDRLTGGGPSRQVIPITGMGGIGKTTLARNAYEHQLTSQYFDIRAWVTVSQEYSVRDILVGLLKEIGVWYDKKEASINEDDVGLQLYKELYGRRYLIVLDDIWSIDAWDNLRQFFPYDNSGSRLMVTTRILDVADHVGSTVVKMSFLDDDKSWSLFCQKVFGSQESCPGELEGIGKKIVRSCMGLPLSIIVIGGHLGKSSKTREYWEYIAEDVRSAINLEDDDRCWKLLYPSYVHLPIHLKPCFLYFGIFHEDCEIFVSKLIRLWVAEGFLKPIEAKSLEEAADEYLRDLMDRNLVLAHDRGFTGEIKTVKMHDLVRELCLVEAQKENFLCIKRLPVYISPHVHHIKSQRRVIVPYCSTTVEKKGLQSTASQLARSLTVGNIGELVPLNTCKLLRVLDIFQNTSRMYRVSKIYPSADLLHLVNSRYLFCQVEYSLSIPIHTFWNLQTLYIRIRNRTIILPSEIWTMRQLRHLEVYPRFYLPNLPRLGNSAYTDRYDDGDFVLKNLQTLARVESFGCSQEFVKRVPKIKTLRTFYSLLDGERVEWSCYCLNNLYYLTKLESLYCYFSSPYLQNLRQDDLAFPHSLKELTLYCARLGWEDMRMIGTLPHLEVLALLLDAFIGPSWSTVEGEFLQLKVLCMSDMDLSSWMADEAAHFPCLQQLDLRRMRNLVEIPVSFADIYTLRSIRLNNCDSDTIVSAKRIVEEAESLGNEDLRVQAFCLPEQREELESLASRNFRISFTWGNLL